MAGTPEPSRATPLTDALVRQIAARLRWRGARSAAARYAGISRQNLGKFFREKGVGRDSEVLLRLDRFSRLPRAEQLLYCGRRRKVEPERAGVADGPATPAESGASDAGDPALPHWML